MIRTFYRDRAQGGHLIAGLYSPLYIQLRPLASFPHVFEKVCRAMCRVVKEEAPEITRVIGIAMAGVPIAAGMCIRRRDSSRVHKEDGKREITGLIQGGDSKLR